MTETESMAIAKLQEKLGSQADIKLIKSEDVEWSDASLGCPKAGMFYPQVITPGTKVTLESKGQRYYVHTAKSRAIVCEKPGKQSMKVSSKKLITLNVEAHTETAKQELAKHLNIKPEEVKTKKVTSVTWEDESLGCPTPKQDYPKHAVRGYVIYLEAKNKNYSFHSDGKDRVFACPAIASE